MSFPDIVDIILMSYIIILYFNKLILYSLLISLYIIYFLSSDLSYQFKSSIVLWSSVIFLFSFINFNFWIIISDLDEILLLCNELNSVSQSSSVNWLLSKFIKAETATTPDLSMSSLLKRSFATSFLRFFHICLRSIISKISVIVMTILNY